MPSPTQAEITQDLIDENTHAVKVWVQALARMAGQGDEKARAIHDMTQTREGLRAIWEFVATINAALAACAFELPFDDEQSARTLKALVERYPQLQWGIDQHREDFPLNELNEGLGAHALAKANARLDAWLGQ